MKINYWPYKLQFKYPFSISSVTRTETNVVFIEINSGIHTGYGEASLPPYLSETQESVISFFKKIEGEILGTQPDLTSRLHYVNYLDEGNYAAKAAVDMALHDLESKKLNLPLYQMWNLENKVAPALFTIGITDNEKELQEKINEAKDFKLLKLKVGRANAVDIVKKVRNHTDKKICVDANQAWQYKNEALETICELANYDVVFVEQPLIKNQLTDLAWLNDKSPVPIIADESMQTVDDIDKIKNACRGINVKLMKCGGLEQAKIIIAKAKQNNMMIVLGCMSESSCGVTAAAHLSPLVDYADLDGPLLIKNDPFSGIKFNNGRLILPDSAGTGAKKL